MQSTILENMPFKPDLIAGTSVGSIVGGLLALAIAPDKITEFFLIQSPKIFSGGRWLFPRLWSSAKYSPDNLRTALSALVGNATLADCKTKFIATGFEMTTGRNAYFQSYGRSSSSGEEIVIGPDQGALMLDVMLASSAAQSYFPGHLIGDWLFWDGGNTGFNAPDMLALSEAKKFSNISEMSMLSLGNGLTPWPCSKQNMENPGIATVASTTFDIAYSGPESAMVWLAQQELGMNYRRINPLIPNYAIDDARPDVLATMIAAAQRQLEN